MADRGQVSWLRTQRHAFPESRRLPSGISDASAPVHSGGTAPASHRTSLDHRPMNGASIPAHHGRMHPRPLQSPADEPPSSRGLGRRPLTAETGVRIPVAVLGKPRLQSGVSAFKGPRGEEGGEVRSESATVDVAVQQAAHLGLAAGHHVAIAVERDADLRVTERDRERFALAPAAIRKLAQVCRHLCTVIGASAADFHADSARWRIVERSSSSLCRLGSRARTGGMSSQNVCWQPGMLRWARNPRSPRRAGAPPPGAAPLPGG